MLNARPVEGFFRRLRWGANGILMAILFAIPWLRIGGEPLVLLDVPNRKFHVFGLVIFPQELYFLWLIVIGLALSLFFFTALAGRLWCGWACPQTVFTDVFAWVAQRVEGWTKSGRPERVAIWRRGLLHAIWIAMSFVIGFHLVSYFVGTSELLARLRGGDLAHPATGFLVVASALSYFDFVYLRQVFCRFLCPYARFQGVLFDSDTLIIGYDHLRGEPRGKRGTAGTGDCVDCGLCVAVCPASIDIRNGMQVDCIACTQCIDACDGVMSRLGRRPGLIAYRSLVGLERLRPLRVVRPRVVVYGVLLAAVLGTFGVALARRELIDLYVAHNQTSLFGSSADGRSTNGYVLHITNRDRADHVLRLRLDAPSEYELVAGVNPLHVPATSTLETRVFVLRDEERHEEAEEEARTEGDHAPPAGHDLRFVLEPIDGRGPGIERTIRYFERPGTVAGGSVHAH